MFLGMTDLAFETKYKKISLDISALLMLLGNYIRILCALSFIYLIISKSIIRRVEELNPFFFFPHIRKRFKMHLLQKRDWQRNMNS
jgi:hypothetical protein